MEVLIITPPLLYKHYFPLRFRNPERLETLVDSDFQGFFVVCELRIYDRFAGFDGDTGRSHFDRFDVLYKLSFPCFREAITNCVPGERRDDHGICGVRLKIEVHKWRVLYKIK